MGNGQIKRKVKLLGMGRALAGKALTFGEETRYRLDSGETLLDLAELAAGRALDEAGMKIKDIDCMVCAMATPLQAIPCNAALVHERMAKGLDIPAMDINTTCTSFISALDVMSCMVEAGRYETVLLISGDTASAALNPDQQESYELFSDAFCYLFLQAFRCIWKGIGDIRSFDQRKIIHRISDSVYPAFSEGLAQMFPRNLQPVALGTSSGCDVDAFDIPECIHMFSINLVDVCGKFFGLRRTLRVDTDLILANTFFIILLLLMQSVPFNISVVILSQMSEGYKISLRFLCKFTV